MDIFDTHFHFSGEETPEEYVSKIRENLDVASSAANLPAPEKLYLCAVGGSMAESLNSQRFANDITDTVFAVGIHPHNAEEYTGDTASFDVFLRDKKLAAVGELGLDYFYDFCDRDQQRIVFKAFLDFALKNQLPAIVHLRDKDDSFQAYDDALALLTPFAAAGGRFVVHCYTGGLEYLPKLAALGAWFGVTGMATFKKSENIRQQLPLIPPEKLLIETDSPYLAPVPFRGKENTPGFLPLVVRVVAETLNMSGKELATLTTANAKRFFARG